MVQTSYWHVLVKDHRKTLEQLFGNIAQGKISDEFTQLKHRYLAYGRTPDAVNKVNAAQRSLIENAQLFHEEVSEDNYQIALEAFKAYMRTLFPHWRWTRELSAAFDAYQYEFHLI
jgi:hypothetical protein